MGQRPSMQQPSGEVARRPRTSSDLANGSAAASARRQPHHHRNGGTAAHNSSRSSRFMQQDSTSTVTSSSSSSNNSTDEDNRSEEDAAGGAELAAMLMSHLGMNTSGHAGIGPASSVPSSSSMHRSGRRSENGPTTNSSLFHGRTAQNHHRLGGSQRARSMIAANTAGSSASDLLASGRLGALLQSLDAAVASSVPTSSSSSSGGGTARAMGTQQQQAALKRLRHSLPLLQLLGRDIQCPVCHKQVPSDDVEVHLVMCLTRPVLSYNDDVLTADKGECSICLEEMAHGDNIARLPCLCIYHKNCIDEWFKRKNTCPEHPPVEED